MGTAISTMLRLYNTLTRKKEPFVPLETGRTRMYVCGMTTYSEAHIGHARTYVAFDVIRRYLEYRGFTVEYVQNITDIDDKIIAAAAQKNIDPFVYSAECAQHCSIDMDNLGINPASVYPKASENISAMVNLIERLIKKGHAYTAGGDVYFSVETLEDYGKLSGQNINEMKSGVRITPGEHKKNPLDFALWKAAKPGEPFWQSPWGNGRPGWHIECSAMSNTYLGMPLDIHGGGQDLIFPHHENEIAQAEAAFERRFVNYWLHSGMLKVNSQKMSKSLGNIINISNALKMHSPETLRYFFISYHYRSPADFTDEALNQAESSLARLRGCRQKLEDKMKVGVNFIEKNLSEREYAYLEHIRQFIVSFEVVMDDDINTPKALDVLFEFVKTTNKFLMENQEPNPALITYAHERFLGIASVLSLALEQKLHVVSLEENVELNKKIIALAALCGIATGTFEELIDGLLESRKRARAEKNYQLADTIRDTLQKAGIEIEDIGTETKWRIP